MNDTMTQKYLSERNVNCPAIIRECFPESILLGSLQRPVAVRDTCLPAHVDADPSIAACICTTPLCNGPGPGLLLPTLSQPGQHKNITSICLKIFSPKNIFRTH